jgi:predicted AAA+ superfamily ATPase
LKTKNIDLDNVFYINKELDEKKEIEDTFDLTKSFEVYEKENEVKYIIIDEVQDIEEWEIFIRAKFATKKYKIIIT